VCTYLNDGKKGEEATSTMSEGERDGGGKKGLVAIFFFNEWEELERAAGMKRKGKERLCILFYFCLEGGGGGERERRWVHYVPFWMEDECVNGTKGVEKTRDSNTEGERKGGEKKKDKFVLPSYLSQLRGR